MAYSGSVSLTALGIAIRQKDHSGGTNVGMIATVQTSLTVFKGCQLGNNSNRFDPYKTLRILAIRKVLYNAICDM